MKKLIKLFLILLVPILLLLIYLLYSKPIFVEINPFYIPQPIEGWSDYTFRKDIIPKVVANTPSGWEIQTLNQKIMTIPNSNDFVMEGLIGILIYKENELISKIYAVGDTGGGGITFYKFPDYDPEIYSNLDIESDLTTVIEIQEGEYTEIEMFGTQIRRVKGSYGDGYIYLPNVSDKPAEYFANSSKPVLFYFDNPLFEYFTDQTHYQIWIREDAKNEDLLTLDSILESMEVR